MTKPLHETASHVTDDEAQAVASFAAEVGELLSLPRYRYNVMVDPSDDDALASVETVQHRWVAQIYLNSDWMNRSDEERMNCVIHEVCHLLHRGVDYLVFRETRHFMHDHEHSLVIERYQRETELMVDHIAMFITDFTTVKKTWEKLHTKKR